MALPDIVAELEAARTDGIIKRYAIGGAVGATFYIEPSATQDVDVFVLFNQPSSRLVSLAPIYSYFTARGAVVQDDHLVIADWPVQFLPSTTPLVEDALANAVSMRVDEQPVTVISQEHLAAIALETGRMKEVSFSMDDALRAKRVSRAMAAAKPIAEKLRMLERLRERDRAIKRAVVDAPRRPPHDTNA